MLWREASGTSKPIKALLWGDGVVELGETKNGRARVRARGSEDRDIGWVDADAIKNGEPLLEIYFIDVGQGDGLLIRTPDFRHVMIDGGFPRNRQPSRRNAADFVDWKFVKEYGLEHVRLDAMIASHNDEDHYGGLFDLLNVAATEEEEDGLDCKGVTVDAFYHAGLSWWKTAAGARTLGEFEEAGGERFYVQLLDDRASVGKAIDPNSGEIQLQGNWARLFGRVHKTRTLDNKPTPVKRLSQQMGNVPGFDDPAIGALRVLAPIDFDVGGKTGIRKFAGSDSKQTNGNSVLLRLDFKRARILLTGDLNKGCQTYLLKDYEGDRLEFKCDVAKACHHGSDDVSFAFLQAMEPAATVISSGDDEGHDHPRAAIVAASGVTGYLAIEDDEVQTPLVYCTELARSYKLGQIEKIHGKHDGHDAEFSGTELGALTADMTIARPGSLNPEKKSKNLADAMLVAGLTYGLVNLRTNGEKILMATMNEGEPGFTVKTFNSRF